MRQFLYFKKGFTLIELMVTMAVAAVLLMVAAPGVVSFQRNSEMTSITNSLLSAINAARAEAMKTGLNAMVVPADGKNWSSGLIVFVDKDRDNVYTENSDVLVLEREAMPSYITISGTGNANSANPYIMFNGSGYAKSYGLPAGVANLTLTIARNDIVAAQANAEMRRIVVALTGRVRSCRPSNDSSCTPNSVG
ncbi:GspH/FimT family pseudopilin [Comamonas guangdongensis]|uniref:Type II secretion system protein H n=1 Tax=Comamonas guangdongensis TaxID=510515 RepID=A0ABV3ZR31_9BURK